MKLIELNLAKSPQERIHAHQRALAIAARLRDAVRRRNAGANA
jgi:hypothetical protein